MARNLIKYSLIVLLVAYAAHWFYDKYSIDTIHLTVEGHADDKFKDIIEQFRTILASERDGVAFAVYHRGRLVIDLWGGYSDKVAGHPWERDTMSVVFSSTKAVGSIIIAMLASRGLLSYDDLVIKYWPEFGKHGKSNVTIEWLVDHRAGLSASEEFSIEDARNHEFISKIFEEMTPMWPPGTKRAYHALTHGWLIDQLVRRVDEKKRSANEFYRDEIRPYSRDGDFYVGISKEMEYRMARITPSPIFSLSGIISLIKNPYIFIGMMTNKFLQKVFATPKFYSLNSKYQIYNNQKIHQLEQWAAGGIGTARGLAAVFNTIAENKMLDANVWKRISQPVDADGADLVIPINITRGHGFFLTSIGDNELNRYLIGHPGYGGQSVDFDYDQQISLAFIRNGLTNDFMAIGDYRNMLKNVVRIIENS